MANGKVVLDIAKIEPGKIAEGAKLPESVVKKVIQQMVNEKEKNKRQPSPPPPKGGISIRAASRKYGVPSPTISRWVKRGFIPIISRTKNWLYINEACLREVISKYLGDPGRGKKTLGNNH